MPCSRWLCACVPRCRAWQLFKTAESEGQNPLGVGHVGVVLPVVGQHWDELQAQSLSPGDDVIEGLEHGLIEHARGDLEVDAIDDGEGKHPDDRQVVGNCAQHRHIRSGIEDQ